MARPGSRSWRVTADWHQEMTGGHPDSSKAVGAAWAKMLGCLTALAVLATALPRPGELVSTVVDALTGAGHGTGGAAAGGIRSAETAPRFLDTAQDALLLAAGLIVWALLVWALAIAIIAGLGRLPGAGGRAARKALRRIAPAAAGRLVIVAVGMTAIAGAAGCAAPDSTGAALVRVANAATASGAASSTDPSTPLVDIDWPDPVDGSSSSPETPAPTAGDSPAGTASTGTQPTGTTDQSPPQSGLDPAAPVSTAPAAPVSTAPAVPVSTAPAAANPNGDPTDTTPPDSTPPDPAAADAPDTTAPTAIPSAANPSPAPTTTETGTFLSSTPRPTAPPSAGDPDAPSTPAVGPARATGTDTPTPAPGTAAEADGSVTVQPGDTLWAIAARDLPSDATDAEIDTAWRARYAANVEVIGADPNLIIPGQHLLPGHSEMRP